MGDQGLMVGSSMLQSISVVLAGTTIRKKSRRMNGIEWNGVGDMNSVGRLVQDPL